MCSDVDAGLPVWTFDLHQKRPLTSRSGRFACAVRYAALTGLDFESSPHALKRRDPGVGSSISSKVSTKLISYTLANERR